jgi:hypothetical protein
MNSIVLLPNELRIDAAEGEEGRGKDIAPPHPKPFGTLDGMR